MEEKGVSSMREGQGTCASTLSGLQEAGARRCQGMPITQWKWRRPGSIPRGIQKPGRQGQDVGNDVHAFLTTIQGHQVFITERKAWQVRAWGGQAGLHKGPSGTEDSGLTGKLREDPLANGS